MIIWSKNAIFRPKIELEAIARWSVEASREVDCAYFGNISRNIGYFLLPIFLGSYLTAHPSLFRTLSHVLGCLLSQHMSPAMGQNFLCAPFAPSCFKSFVSMNITILEEPLVLVL